MANPRLGLGEFVPGGANYAARWQFLNAVNQCVPEAIQALAEIAGLDHKDARTPFQDLGRAVGIFGFVAEGRSRTDALSLA
jgi:hypothetical protein